MANKNYEILDNIKIPDVNEIVKLVVDNNIDENLCDGFWGTREKRLYCRNTSNLKLRELNGPL